MKLELKSVKIKDLVEDYVDNGDRGVFGYGGELNIRPAFQREFVYKEKQRNAVIETLRKDFPLNVMYWVRNEDETYELLDGQQRTISICQYVNGAFSINHQYFHNLEKEEKEQILDYDLMIYFCEGDTREKLDWFKVINIAGERLYPQELRNAIYTGPWLADAKDHFSKRDCVAYNSSKDYVKGSPIRQDYLETVLKWINNGDVNGYMAKHQHDKDADALWKYFQKVIAWVKITFPTYRKEMKGVDWGTLYNVYKDSIYNSTTIEDRVRVLMKDEDVTKKTGIYPYIITNKESYLSIRAFNDRDKRTMYEKQ
jgi:hypothetical protein